MVCRESLPHVRYKARRSHSPHTCPTYVPYIRENNLYLHNFLKKKKRGKRSEKQRRRAKRGKSELVRERRGGKEGKKPGGHSRMVVR